MKITLLLPLLVAFAASVAGVLPASAQQKPLSPAPATPTPQAVLTIVSGDQQSVRETGFFSQAVFSPLVVQIKDGKTGAPLPYWFVDWTCSMPTPSVCSVGSTPGVADASGRATAPVVVHGGPGAITLTASNPRTPPVQGPNGSFTITRASSPSTAAFHLTALPNTTEVPTLGIVSGADQSLPASSSALGAVTFAPLVVVLKNAVDGKLLVQPDLGPVIYTCIAKAPQTCQFNNTGATSVTTYLDPTTNQTSASVQVLNGTGQVQVSAVFGNASMDEGGGAKFAQKSVTFSPTVTLDSGDVREIHFLPGAGKMMQVLTDPKIGGGEYGPVTVLVTNGQGKPIAGVPITFAITCLGCYIWSLPPSSTFTTTTDAQGHASTPAQGGISFVQMGGFSPVTVQVSGGSGHLQGAVMVLPTK